MNTEEAPQCELQYFIVFLQLEMSVLIPAPWYWRHFILEQPRAPLGSVGTSRGQTALLEDLWLRPRPRPRLFVFPMK